MHAEIVAEGREEARGLERRSVEDVDDDPAVVASSGGAGDGADRVGDAAAAADDATEVVLGDGDLEDEVAVLFELLDLDLVRLLDESANEELDELAHGGDPAQVPAGPSTPCVRSSLATVGDGWAPWSSQ